MACWRKAWGWGEGEGEMWLKWGGGLVSSRCRRRRGRRSCRRRRSRPTDRSRRSCPAPLHRVAASPRSIARWCLAWAGNRRRMSMQLENALRHVLSAPSEQSTGGGGVPDMALDAGLRAQYCGLRHLRAYESARGLQGAPRQSNAPLSPHEGQAAYPRGVLQPAERCRRSSGCRPAGRGRP